MKGPKYFQLIAIVVLIAVGTGCVNQRTTPAYGRAGDYISLGMAGLKFNTDQHKTIRSTDLTAEFYSVADLAAFPIRVVNTYRAFPDHTSRYAVMSMDRSGDFGADNSDIEPYDGQWWIAMKLDDPVTGLPISALPGLGFIRIFSSDIIDDGSIADGNLTNGLLFELIEGAGQEDFVTVEQFESYAAMRSMTVQPSVAYGVPSVGGFQIKLDYNVADLREVNSVKSPVIPRLVPISHDPNINIIQHTVDNGGGNSSLVAMVTNPNGFVSSSALGVWTPGNSVFEDLNMAVVVDDADSLANWSTEYVLDSVNSYYIDINGMELTGVEPVLGFSN